MTKQMTITIDDNPEMEANLLSLVAAITHGVKDHQISAGEISILADDIAEGHWDQIIDSIESANCTIYFNPV